MATHFSILVWEIPRTEDPGMLQTMALQRINHNIAIKQQQSSGTKIYNLKLQFEAKF